MLILEIGQTEPAPRPPSLTHSRASSSDSAASGSTGSSSVASWDQKPLPALPQSLSPNSAKTRPYSIAILESIDEACSDYHLRSSGVDDLAGTGSQQSRSNHLTPASAQNQFPHLDLASLTPSTSFYSTSSSTASTLTPKRPVSAYTFLTQSSPRTVWTPRDSTCYTPALSIEDDSSYSPFGLELSLARQEALEASPSVRLLSNIVEESPASVDIALPESNDPFNIDLPKPADENQGKTEAEGRIEGEGFAEEEEEAAYIVPLEEEESVFTEPTPRRATIRKRTSMRLSGTGSFVNGGWRNWRAAGSSQPSTPSGEVPPHLSYQVQPPTASAASSISETDYFGSGLVTRLNSIEEASPSSGMLRVDSQDRSRSSLPKLSPEFSFGRRTPSPAPALTESEKVFQVVQEETDETPCVLRPVRESIVPIQQKQRRNRAASADHLGPGFVKPQIVANPVAAAKALSSSSVSHRNRLAMRTFAGNAPRFQARSFDAEELKLLREMTAPKYSWI